MLPGLPPSQGCGNGSFKTSTGLNSPGSQNPSSGRFQLIEVCFQMTEAPYLDLQSSHWVPADYRRCPRHQVMLHAFKTGNCNSTLIQTLPRIQNLRPNSSRGLRGLTCLPSVQATPLACSFGRCPGSQGFFFTFREASGCGGFAREVISVPNQCTHPCPKMLRKMLFHAISLYFIGLCPLCPFSFFILGDPY